MIHQQIPPDYNGLDSAFIAGWRAALEYAATFMAPIEDPLDEGEASLAAFGSFIENHIFKS